MSPPTPDLPSLLPVELSELAESPPRDMGIDGGGGSTMDTVGNSGSFLAIFGTDVTVESFRKDVEVGFLIEEQSIKLCDVKS